MISMTLGGISTDDLSAKTLQAKAVPGLFFIGEAVDVTGAIVTKLDSSANGGTGYALNVLRLNKHSNLIIFNGDGFDYVCEILVCNKSNLRVKVSEKRTLNNESPLKTHLYLGISKSSHMDFAIQKSVETGVTSIQPVMMERTVSKSSNKSLANKHQHWKRIIQSACEQCGRATVPELQESIELHDIEPLLPGNRFTGDFGWQRGSCAPP